MWAVTLADGRGQAFAINESGFEEIVMTPAQLPPGMPPQLYVEGERATLLTAFLESASTKTHPVKLSSSNQTVFIGEAGDVIIWGEEETARFEVNFKRNDARGREIGCWRGPDGLGLTAVGDAAINEARGEIPPAPPGLSEFPKILNGPGS